MKTRIFKSIWKLNNHTLKQPKEKKITREMKLYFDIIPKTAYQNIWDLAQAVLSRNLYL